MSQNGTGYEYLARPARRQVAFANSTVVTAKVFGWMSAGLAITAVVAMFAAWIPALRTFFGQSLWADILLLVVDVVWLWWLVSDRESFSPTTATVLFVIYSVLNGLSLSALFIYCSLESLASTFFFTSAMFGATALYGYFARRDLTGAGNLCLMLLIGLTIVSGGNLLLADSLLGWITPYVGILLFVGLTAYHTQHVRWMTESVYPGTSEAQGVAIYGALFLYLDFINLFFYLLCLGARHK